MTTVLVQNIAIRMMNVKTLTAFAVMRAITNALITNAVKIANVIPPKYVQGIAAPLYNVSVRRELKIMFVVSHQIIAVTQLCAREQTKCVI